MDALYFRVSSDRQTTQNQYEDLVEIAERDDSGRDWGQIRQRLPMCVHKEELCTGRSGPRIVYRVRPEIAVELAWQI